MSYPSTTPVDDTTPACHESSPVRGAAQLLDDFPVPAWSQGSRLGEHRIQQTVDRETAELSEAPVSQQKILLTGGGRSQPPSLRATPAPHSCRRAVGPPLLPQLSSPSSALPSSPHLAVIKDTRTPLLPPRMQEADLPADPRNQLLSLVMTNTSGSVTLATAEAAMAWRTHYELMYGPLLEYLQSYQSIFVVSPVDDRVRLRRLFSVRTNAGVVAEATSPRTKDQPQRRRSTRGAAGIPSASVQDRRPGKKPSLPSAEALAAHIGSVSYSCVGEHLRLPHLETVYRRRGYTTTMMHAVLHVTNDSDFHLFLFPSGAVVWFGMDRKDHWMVEDDFLSEQDYIAEGVEHRYVQSELEALFPIWCSYEVDEQAEHMAVSSPLGVRPAAVRSSLDRLAKVLCFDHYLVPSTEPARSLVMLTFAHSLGRSARADYFEYVTKWSHRHILSIPAEFSGLLDYFSTKRRIARLEGEIAVAQLAIQSIHDTPEVLWEVPWLQAYYDLAEQQNTTQSRLSWFASRSDTLLEQLSHIKGRRHRLFMLGSDVFLIVLLILDVIFMTSRLVAKMYFKVIEED